MKNGIYVGLMTALLSIASTAFAQDTIVYEKFAYKCMTTYEATLSEALQAVAVMAVEEVIPPPSTSDDKRALEATITAARAQAESLVKYKLLEGPRSRVGAAGYVEMRAEIRRSDILELHKRSLTAAASAPRYKIMVLFSEDKRIQIGNTAHLASWERNEDSKVSAAITSMLLDAGWDVVNAAQHEAIRGRDLDYSKMDGKDEPIIQRIALDFGADIIVRGHAKAEGPLTKDNKIAERTFHTWQVDATTHVVWADSGLEIFGIPFPDGKRKAATEVGGTAGAEAALEQAGQTIAHEFMSKMHRVKPRTSLSVTVFGIKDIEHEFLIKEWFAAVPGVQGVTGRRNGPIWIGDVTTQMAPDEFALRAQRISKKADEEFFIKAGPHGATTAEFEITAK